MFKDFSLLTHDVIVNKISEEIEQLATDKFFCSKQADIIFKKMIVQVDIAVFVESAVVPILIFEVVSKQNANLDTITKMKFYAENKVKEYNLVYQEGVILQYKLNEYDMYYLNNSYKQNEIYESLAIEDLKVDINKIF